MKCKDVREPNTFFIGVEALCDTFLQKGIFYFNFDSFYLLLGRRGGSYLCFEVFFQLDEGADSLAYLVF